MQQLRLSQQQFALLCAVILVVVSIAAVARQSEWRAEAQKQLAVSSAVEQPPKPVVSEKIAEKPVAETGNYSYTAASGDSYAVFVRDAIAQYTKDKNIELTNDQLLQAESDLVNAAGAPLLEIGQSVSIAKNAILQALQANGAVALVGS